MANYDGKRPLCTCLSRSSNLAAAQLGCGICGGAVQTAEPICGICRGIRTTPSSDPFSQGPYCGRYWCAPCWVLYWDEHPEHLADEATRRYVAQEAMEIRKSRGWELLYEEGENRAFLTERGTLVIILEPKEGFGVGEYHPEQFQIMMRALREIDRKEIPGFGMSESVSPAQS